VTIEPTQIAFWNRFVVFLSLTSQGVENMQNIMLCAFLSSGVTVPLRP